MIRLIKCFWRIFSRPPVHISLGVLTLTGWFAGIIFWGGFNTALEFTNTEEFCISCHEMRDNNYEELKGTVHWSNHSGVRATCPDCHVPHKWTDKIARKMQASKEVWAAIAGWIDTREKFEDRRLELARHEWARFSANNSLECKNCHEYASMKWEDMSPQAVRFMKPAAERDQSCIDCHKGIAHRLPEMEGSTDPVLARLEQQAGGLSVSGGTTYYSVASAGLFSDEAMSNGAGSLKPATAVEVVATNGDAVQIAIHGWRKAKGFGRVIFQGFGMNITSAVLSKEAAQSADVVKVEGEDKVDELTGLPWQQVTVTLWVKKGDLLESIDDLWAFAGDSFSRSCSVCHAHPDPEHFDANTWPGMFAGMVGFTNLNGDSKDLVLKYLQNHSSDFASEKH